LGRAVRLPRPWGPISRNANRRSGKETQFLQQVGETLRISTTSPEKKRVKGKKNSPLKNSHQKSEKVAEICLPQQQPEKKQNRGSSFKSWGKTWAEQMREMKARHSSDGFANRKKLLLVERQRSKISRRDYFCRSISLPRRESKRRLSSRRLPIIKNQRGSRSVISELLGGAEVARGVE